MGRGGQVEPLRDVVETRKPKPEGKEPFDATILFVLWPRPGRHQAPADGSVICKARREDTGEEVILKGKFGPVADGALITVAEWSRRVDQRGEHIRVWRIQQSDPVTREALVHYLSELPGVGEKMAEAIIDHFGSNCLAEIDKDPSKLLDVETAAGRRIPQTKLQDLRDRWEELRADRKNLIFLSSLGLGDATARKVITKFGAMTADVIRENPYALTEVEGIGFRIADRVARKQGIASDDPRRISAGVVHVLDEALSSGHICLRPDEIKAAAPKLLGAAATEERVCEAISELEAAGRLVIDEFEGEKRAYTARNYLIETRLYELLEKRLTRTPDHPPAGLERPAGSPATDEQWLAVERGLTEPISVLTGSAGTGKTSALKELISACKRHDQSFVLLAPTGKAAKRITESTGEKASTIHRRLGPVGMIAPSPGQDMVDRNAMAQLDADVVIVDEASMLDMEVAERLLSHLPERTRLVLVGDPNQLPAVGAGSVLHDLIESGRVPTTKLSKIFRQAEDSLLVVNANRIKDGKEPYWTREEAEKDLGHPVRDDFEFIEAASAEAAEAEVQKQAARLARELGVSDDEVMITAPTKKGAAGVGALNQVMRSLRNPQGELIREGELELHAGDRVMNIENRYARRDPRTKNPVGPDIMNGDVGKIVEWDPDTKTAWVEFEGIDERVSFTADQLSALIPAYAATTHKLQGSEAPGLVAPYVTATRLLSRNLIYTALTRGKEKAVLVGSKDVIRHGVGIDGSKRKTTLDLRVGRIRERLKVRWEAVDLAEKRQLEAEERRHDARRMKRLGFL